MIVIFDSESDGLLYEATKFWCFSTVTIDGEAKHFGPDEIEDALAYLASAEVIVAHNLFGHDLPLIQKLYPDFVPPKCEDTLILSRMFTPDRPNGHSIQAWGPRVGLDKPDHTDWTQYSDAMKVRCDIDAEINKRMLRPIQFEMGKENWDDAVRLEYDMQILQTQQELLGFPFDEEKARHVYTTMSIRQQNIMAELTPQLPAQMKPGTTYKAPFTKAGKLNHHVAKWVQPELHDSIMGPFSGVRIDDFNLNSPQQVSALLLDNGWEPTEFNYVKRKGGGYELNKDGSYKISTPKISEDLSCLDSVTGEIGRLIVDARVLRSRMGEISRTNKDGSQKGWLHLIRDDGRVSGRAIPMGTPTSRYTHAGIVNVPRPSTEYGEELRSLFVAEEGKAIVGTDASGLEARVAGHFTAAYDGGAFAKELMEGDIHSKNAAAFSSAVNRDIDRTHAKNVYYGIIYGATARKLASMLGVPYEEGEVVFDSFWAENPALAAASQAAQSQAKSKGYILGLDGRRIPCRSTHSALNYQFQSAGALIMKDAFRKVFLEQVPDPMMYWHDDPAIRWRCLLTQHDEAQASMLYEDVDDHIAVWQEAGEEVTDHFAINIPIEFESKVGTNWCETH